ncbi:hypothetical protein OCU04_002086 [Sclerotinia nivalis]|uniref:BTB domain-containing protein n=1 Tax=Sclerotinia nivalis TaxID=352851 RepID=A0A9X0AZE5_9HELO|nr:hypothetical protein OCU04_002086 [Sclerotinia nivalis]
MDGDTMVLDPDGDVVLVLDLKELASETVVDAASTDPSGHEMSADPSSEDVVGTTSTDSPDDKTPSADSSSDSLTVSISPTPEPKKIRFVVSSRHLSLASPVFKAMLRGNFQEGVKLKEAGKIEIPLPDDDSAAWKILLNIIHGQYMAIPLQLKLQVITQIAVLVDKYRMHEVVYLFVPTWRKAMDYPPTRWEDIISWICISWVFELREEFRELTKKVQLDCVKTFESTIRFYNLDNLPIPQLVIDRIDASRRKAIEKAFDILGNTISQYQKLIPNCNRDNSQPHLLVKGLESHKRWCDIMVHGSLVRSATLENIYPIPSAPYEWLSFSDLKSRIGRLEIVTACYMLMKNTKSDHQIHQTLIASTDSAGDELVGLLLGVIKVDEMKPQCPTQ